MRVPPDQASAYSPNWTDHSQSRRRSSREQADAAGDYGKGERSEKSHQDADAGSGTDHLLGASVFLASAVHEEDNKLVGESRKPERIFYRPRGWMRDVPAACFRRIFAASSSFFFCRLVPSRLVPPFYRGVSSYHPRIKENMEEGGRGKGRDN